MKLVNACSAAVSVTGSVVILLKVTTALLKANRSGATGESPHALSKTTHSVATAGKRNNFLNKEFFMLVRFGLSAPSYATQPLFHWERAWKIALNEFSGLNYSGFAFNDHRIVITSPGTERVSNKTPRRRSCYCPDKSSRLSWRIRQLHL